MKTFIEHYIYDIHKISKHKSLQHIYLNINFKFNITLIHFVYFILINI